MPRHTMTAALAAMAMIVAATMATPTRAQGYTPIDAEAQIKKCWDLSQADRDSGATHRMRSGTAKTIGCLEESIIENVGIMFTPTIIANKQVAPPTLTKEQAQKHPDELQNGIQRMYWLIYNGHDGCIPSCGTMWHVMHVAANAKILEEMLRDMARHWDKYPPSKIAK